MNPPLGTMGSGNNKEVIMGTTLRNLSGTFKQAKADIASGKIEELSALNDDYDDDFNIDSARHENVVDHKQAQPQFLGVTTPNHGSNEMAEPLSDVKVVPGHEEAEEEEEEDVIDIDNPDDLAAKGLKRIQIEGEEEEYLMDLEGNIYDLRGNFIGTTDDDGADGSAVPNTQSHAGINVGGNSQAVSQNAQNVDDSGEVNEDDVEYGEY